MISSVFPGMTLKDIPKEATQLHFVRPVKKELLESIPELQDDINVDIMVDGWYNG